MVGAGLRVPRPPPFSISLSALTPDRVWTGKQIVERSVHPAQLEKSHLRAPVTQQDLVRIQLIRSTSFIRAGSGQPLRAKSSSFGDRNNIWPPLSMFHKVLGCLFVFCFSPKMKCLWSLYWHQWKSESNWKKTAIKICSFCPVVCP